MLLKDDSMEKKGYKMTPFSPGSAKYHVNKHPATTITGNHQKETCTDDSANKIKQKEDLCKQTFGETWGFGVFNC
jgi:hypothetical protein